MVAGGDGSGNVNVLAKDDIVVVTDAGAASLALAVGSDSAVTAALGVAVVHGIIKINNDTTADINLANVQAPGDIERHGPVLNHARPRDQNRRPPGPD